MKVFHARLTEVLARIIQREFDTQLPLPLWEISSRRQFGDLSSMAAMKLAAQLSRNPHEIVEILARAFSAERIEGIEKIEIVQPAFLNIFFSKPLLAEFLTKVLKDKESCFRGQSTADTNIEFCSANPTGPLSIAHGRQAIIGDVIANILEFSGARVTREYYVNDAGTQLSNFLMSVQLWLAAPEGVVPEIPEKGYKGEYLRDIAAAIKTNPQWQKDSAHFDIRSFCTAFVLAWIRKDFTDLGIRYDVWASQQNLLDAGHVASCLDELTRAGLLFEKDGAQWFASSRFGDDQDRVIRKADGELTYFASDIAYHRDKFQRGHTRLINLWGPDHHGYIPRVKAALESLGYNREALQIIIIQLVTLKSKEKMSKRRGTVRLLSDLIEDVGKDAVRFFYLSRRNSSLLEFDLDLAKEKSVNNPLYYAQYACARIESIFEKAKECVPAQPDYTVLHTQEELTLLKILAEFYFVAQSAAYALEPVFIVEYIKQLAQAFHKFYETTKVITDDSAVTAARLDLIAACRIVFGIAMGILGITPAKKM